jgi:ABC-type lipoprotein release transport system permease subunit
VAISEGALKALGFEQLKVPQPALRVTVDPDEVTGRSGALFTQQFAVAVLSGDAPAVYLPRAFLEQALTGATVNYEDVRVKVGNVEQVFEAQRNVVAQGFRAEAVIDTKDQVQSIFLWVRWVLGTLGAIAVGVAAIGMFNTLTVSLLERTNEIGVMKALGVRKRDVRKLFLAEAWLIGFLGGISGIVFAYVLEFLVPLPLEVKICRSWNFLYP